MGTLTDPVPLGVVLAVVLLALVAVSGWALYLKAWHDRSDAAVDVVDLAQENSTLEHALWDIVAAPKYAKGIALAALGEPIAEISPETERSP